MPNHIHLVITLFENKEVFQRDFLKYTAQKLITMIYYEKNKNELLHYLSTQNDRYIQIWERRPKWIKIDNTIILEQKIEYIHNNPLQQKWKLSNAPENYQWSSASFYIIQWSVLYFSPTIIPHIVPQVPRITTSSPEDFMFHFTTIEYEKLMSQFAISSWDGTRKIPYAFAEQGVVIKKIIRASDETLTR